LMTCVIALAGLLALGGSPAFAADAAFTRWLEGLWPEAQKLGVSRKTFEAATRALEPDLTLPDLDLPGRSGQPQRGQAEFIQTPADYIKEANIANLAAQPQELGGGAARRQGLAARHALGLRGARAQGRRLHDQRARNHAAGRRVAQARLCAGLWAQAERSRAGGARLAAAARGQLWPGLPHAQE